MEVNLIAVRVAKGLLGMIDEIIRAADYVEFRKFDSWSAELLPSVSIRDYRSSTIVAYDEFARLGSDRSSYAFRRLDTAFSSDAILEVGYTRENTLVISLLDATLEIGPAQAMLGGHVFHGDAYSYGWDGSENAYEYQIVVNDPLWSWSSIMLTHEQINDAEVHWFFLTNAQHRVEIRHESKCRGFRDCFFSFGIEQITR